MKAKLRIAGHPVHHMLIVFPLGLLATSFFFDLAYLARGRGELAIVAWWMIFAGVIGGVVFLGERIGMAGGLELAA